MQQFPHTCKNISILKNKKSGNDNTLSLQELTTLRINTSDQGVIYTILASDKFLKDKPDAGVWHIQVTFIVIDKYNLVYPFQVSTETMNQWKSNFKSVLEIAQWHYVQKRYDLPYELAVGNVKL